MRRSVLSVAGIAAALLAAAGCRPSVAGSASVAAAPGALAFEAKFESASDFYDRFDMGYSGIGPLESLPVAIKGDHDMKCGGPTTQRDVKFGGTTANVDYSQLFWFCAPGGDPTKGHVMTGVDTHGYNIAWFSPKPAFTGISKVCWDINETTMSARKWTQVLFVGDADAHRYPTGMSLPGDTKTFARGTGGFDLGYTSPEFRQGQPNNQFFPEGGTLAGLKDGFGIFDWFQNQDTWTARGVGWPGLLPQGLPGGLPITDKAARYKHCVENQPNNTILVTMDSPIGQLTRTLPGQIPQDARRVVFEDDNYNPSKGDFYDPNVLTWHWDNIQVEATAAVELAAPPSRQIAAATSQPSAAPSPSPGGETALGPQQHPPIDASSASPGANLGVANVVGLVLTILGLVALLLFGPFRSVGLARRGSGLRPEEPSEEA